MLQTIRDHTQGWIAGTIISIIILTFMLWGVHSYFVGGGTTINVASVNGAEISKEQLAIAYERLASQAKLQAGSSHSLKATEKADLRNNALQGLIDVEVLKQASTKQGFRIYDKQIDDYLKYMPEFQVNGQFSIERFQDVLSSNLLSTSEFWDLVKTNLLIEQPKLGIILTAFSLPNETTNTIGLVNQQREIAYLTIPVHYPLPQLVVIPPKQIQQYYEQHRANFMTPDQVNIEYIELSLKNLSTNIHPTESAVKQFYNENINSYAQPMRWKFNAIEIPIASNASADVQVAVKSKAVALAAALKQSNQLDKIAADFSGKLSHYGWLSLNQVEPLFQKAVAQLSKSDQVSDLIRSPTGYVVIKAEAIQGPQMQSFESVKSKVQETLVRQQAEEKLIRLREQLADLTYEHPDSLQTAAKSLNLPIKNSELFGKNKPTKDIAQYKKIREAAFSNDVLNLQNNSDVIQISPEQFIVLRVKSHVPSTLLPLSNVSQQIEAKLKAEAVELKLNQFAESLKNNLVNGANPEQVATSNHLSWNSIGFIGRYSNKVDSAILDLAFRMPNPALSKNKISYDLTRTPTGYAIVVLKSVKQGSMIDKKQYSVFAEQIQNSDGMLEYMLYKFSQMKKAKIKNIEQ